MTILPASAHRKPPNKRTRILLSTPTPSRSFLRLSSSLVEPDRARGRRWIDCYCNAGEATQRRAAFYPLQRHGKGAKGRQFQCRGSVDQRNEQCADRLSFNNPDDLGCCLLIVNARLRSTAFHSPQECPATP